MTLSRRLRSPKLDLSDGSAMAESVIKRLQEWRLHVAEFSVFDHAATLADIAGVQLVKPRVNGRQLHNQFPMKPTMIISSV